LAVVLEWLGAIAEVNGAVEVSVGFDQRGGHRQRVVKVGQRRVGEFLAHVQHALRGCLHSGAPFGARRFGPRVVVSAVAPLDMFFLLARRDFADMMTLCIPVN